MNLNFKIASIVLFGYTTMFGVSNCVAQGTFFEAGAGISFFDLGIDPVTNEIVLVGSENVGGQNTASVFRLSADRTSLQSDALVGLVPNSTIVRGISPDGSTIAGTSTASDGSLQATTWLSTAPSTPIGIGSTTPSGDILTQSSGIAAFNGGIVGTATADVGFPIFSRFEFTPPNSLSVSRGDPFGVGVSAVSADGSVTLVRDFDTGVPFAADSDPATGGATFGFGNFDTLREVSPNGLHIAGDADATPISGVGAGTGGGVWSRDSDDENFVFTLLFSPDFDLPDPQPLFTDVFSDISTVIDVSDSGFAIGNADNGPFIWNESFDDDSGFSVVENFDEWLLRAGGIALPSPTTAVRAITESETGVLNFAVQTSESSFIVTVVPEPSSAAILTVSMIGFTFRRKRDLVG